MRRSAVLSVISLAAILASSAVAAQATGPSSTFSDYVNSVLSPSTKPASYQDGDYKYRHERTLKLLETQLNYCSEFDYGDFMMQSDFQCCNDNHGDAGFAPLGLSVGNCVWTGRFLSYYNYVQLSETLWRVGTITANCQLNKEIGECGGPECDKLMLNLQGDLYAVISQSHQENFYHNVGSGTTIKGKSCCIMKKYDFHFADSTCDPCEYMYTCDDCFDCCVDCTRRDSGDALLDGEDKSGKCKCCRRCDERSMLPIQDAPANTTAPAWAPEPDASSRHGLKDFRQALKDKRLKGKRATTPTQGSHSGQSADIWVGDALVGMGTATVLSMGNHGHEQIEEVARWSSVLDWDPYYPLPSADPNLHWVHPGTFELTWTEEQEAHGYKA